MEIPHLGESFDSISSLNEWTESLRLGQGTDNFHALIYPHSKPPGHMSSGGGSQRTKFKIAMILYI